MVHIEHPDIAQIIATGYPYSKNDVYIICPNCGIKIYEGDMWYPDWNVCENCIDDFKKEVDL